jgi:hypothetical protein
MKSFLEFIDSGYIFRSVEKFSTLADIDKFAKRLSVYFVEGKKHFLRARNGM